QLGAKSHRVAVLECALDDSVHQRCEIPWSLTEGGYVQAEAVEHPYHHRSLLPEISGPNVDAVSEIFGGFSNPFGGLFADPHPIKLPVKDLGDHGRRDVRSGRHIL